MIWALVPVKDLRLSKSRLAGVLSPDERRALTLAMLADVLSALAAVTEPMRRVVVGRDGVVHQQASSLGAEFLAESPDTRGLNAAVELGLSLATDEGASAALVVPADVPLITPHGIERVLPLAQTPPMLGLCAAADGHGTNGLLLAPPRLIAPRFGVRSFQAHFDAGHAAGARIEVFDPPGLSLDLDEPDDLARFLSRATQGATFELLNELQMGDRLRDRESALLAQSEA